MSTSSVWKDIQTFGVLFNCKSEEEFYSDQKKKNTIWAVYCCVGAFYNTWIFDIRLIYHTGFIDCECSAKFSFYLHTPFSALVEREESDVVRGRWHLLDYVYRLVFI